MKEIIISKAERKDIQDIKNLIGELITAVHDNKGIYENEILKNIEFLFEADNNYFFIVKIKNKMIGFANISFRNTILHRSKSALIDELVISEEFQGKNIGQKLLKYIIDYCQKMGCGELEVGTEIYNKDAIEFYKKVGFKERGLLLEFDFE
jgi:GNAT superfamily N-acetyltransferase